MLKGFLIVLRKIDHNNHLTTNILKFPKKVWKIALPTRTFPKKKFSGKACPLNSWKMACPHQLMTARSVMALTTQDMLTAKPTPVNIWKIKKEKNISTIKPRNVITNNSVCFIKLQNNSYSSIYVIYNIYLLLLYLAYVFNLTLYKSNLIK